MTIEIDTEELMIGFGPAPLAYLSLAILCASLGITIEVVSDNSYEVLIFQSIITGDILAEISTEGMSGTLLLTSVRQIGQILSGQPDDDEDDESYDWVG